jgi:hypothetical protein
MLQHALLAAFQHNAPTLAVAASAAAAVARESFKNWDPRSWHECCLQIVQLQHVFL